MGGAGAGQRLCFGEAPRGAHSHQRELKQVTEGSTTTPSSTSRGSLASARIETSNSHGTRSSVFLEGLTRISAN